MTIINTPKNYQEYFCEMCDYKCYHSNNFNKHLMTLKHKNKENTIINTPKKYPEYFCEKCDFKCSNKKDYNRHLLTPKHKNKEKNPIKIPKEYTCDCGKSYKHMASLYNHKHKCNNISKDNDTVCSDNNINLLMNELQRRDEEQKIELQRRDEEQQKQLEEQQQQHKKEVK